MQLNYKHDIISEIYHSKNKREITLDNTIVEKHFLNSNKIPVRYTPTLKEELTSIKKERLNAIKDIIDLNLPELEKKIIRRAYYDNMKQEGIAKIYGLSQEMVSYYKSRAERRIRYYIKAKNISLDDMRIELKGVVTRKQLEALIMYFKHHNQNYIANRFGVTQSAISSRLKLGLKQIGKYIPENPFLQRYHDIFSDLFLYNSLQSKQSRKGI